MSPRRPAANPDTPPRVMVVTCPDLHGADLSAGPGRETARRHERMVAVVTGFCPDVEVVEPGVWRTDATNPFNLVARPSPNHNLSFLKNLYLRQM